MNLFDGEFAVDYNLARYKSIYKPESKEIMVTEARRMIREEKFDILKTRKREKILVREIDKFRTRLEMERALNKLETKISNEKKHRSTSNGTKKYSIQLHSAEKIEDEFDLKGLKATKKLTGDRSIPLTFLPQTELRDIKEGRKNKRQQQLQQELSQLVQSLKQETHQSQESNKESTSNDRARKCELNSGKISENKNNDLETIKAKTQAKNKRRSKPVTITAQTEKAVNDCIAQTTIMHYWSKWKLFVAARKSKREEEKMWREKIHNFLQKFHDRPAFISAVKKEIEHPPSPHNKKGTRVTGAKLVQNKSRPQLAIINDDMSAIKKAITESTIQTQQATKSNLGKLDPRLKSKAKLMRQFMVKIPEQENKREELKVRVRVQPQILEAMDRKHTERKERLASLQEHKLLLEQEKDRIAKEKYEQQILQAEMEKKRKIREFRKKQRMEKLQQEQRRAEWLRIKELEQKAIAFYNHKLLNSGYRPWQCLITNRRNQSTKALDYSDKRILKCAFRSWREALQEIEEIKMRKALVFGTKRILRTATIVWKGVVNKRRLQMQVAEDWFDYLLANNALRSWQNYVFLEQAETEKKWKLAIAHHKTKLMTECIKHWMLLPQVICLERAKEMRKKEWREKVQQVLPDFRPIYYEI